MNLFNFFNKKSPVIIIDMLSLFYSLGFKGNIPPRTQLQILRRLTKFSDREKIRIIAVLSGEALYKAPNGKKFDNILILYSNSVSNHINKAIRVTKSKNGILITDDSKASKSNITTVRCRTFKKAFDLNNDTRNKPSSSFKRRSKENSNNYKNQAIEENNTQNDTINELIDLVD